MAFTPPPLASETIAHIGSFPIRNSMIMSWIAVLLLIVVAIMFRKKGGKLIPKGFQNFIEVIVEGLFNFFNQITQDHGQTKKFFPIVATIFLYVLLSNWMGLLPGVGPIGIWEEHRGTEETAIIEKAESIESLRNAKKGKESGRAQSASARTERGSLETRDDRAEDELIKNETTLILVPILRSAYSDINLTLAIALISVFMTQIFGFMALGFKHYAGKFFVNPLKDFIGSFVGILELISEFAKIVSFSFRLFGNIFAGEVLLAVIGFLLPFLAPLPFYGLELFVGMIQALVFSLLTAVFMKMAVSTHEDAHGDPNVPNSSSFAERQNSSRHEPQHA